MDPTKTAEKAASVVWNCPADEISSQEMSETYVWAKKHTVVLVQNAQFQRMLVAVAPDHEPLVFHDPNDVAGNLKSLNALLQSEGVSLPDGMSSGELAFAARTFLSGIGGFVGSPQFLEEQESAMRLWTSPSPEEGPKLFRKYCQEPKRTGDGRAWTLQFFYFNNRGGVEEWNLAGDTREIRQAKFTLVAPNGTFSFPYG